MNVSFKWLNEIAPGLGLSVDEAKGLLAQRGAPVEDVIELGQGLKDVVIGRVIEAGKHPNADRLSLCRVEGPEGEVQVVCGAPNVEAGALYPFAPVGAVLPGDFKIQKRKIRGEVSEGMLCSETELGLGSDGDGIMKLEGDFTVGSSFAEALELDDVCLDVEVTPNRGDLLSHVGIAREVHPKGVDGTLLPEIPGGGALTPTFERDEEEASSAGVQITILDPELCTRYMGAVIRDVTVGPSPEWLAARLRAVGARPINNVVDATNYVLLELGQPTHAFDLARLAGPDIVVRRAKEDEELQTLDGEDRPVTEDMLMICDRERPLAIAGVMGGRESEVTDGTSDVLLECALFEPKQIRATRRALSMSTDASYRFERGVDPESQEAALLRTVEIILAVAGGTLDGSIIDVGAQPGAAPVVSLRPSRVGHLLGVDFSKPEITALLSPLGYTVEDAADDELKVTVPGFRSYDTLREVDLIEEVARAHGFHAFPQDLGPYRPGTVPDSPLFQLEDALRARLVSEGLSEAQTPTLGPEEHGDVALLNPMSRQEGRLRRDRLAGLLTHVERNLARGVRNVRLFEFGTGFEAASDASVGSTKDGGGESEGNRPIETPRVAVALTGNRGPVHWSQPDQPFDVFDVGHLLGVVGEAMSEGSQVVPAQSATAPYAPEASYDLIATDGTVLGRAGKIAKAAVDVPPWAGDVFGLEVILSLSSDPPPIPVAKPLPSQPSSSRDIAFIVPAEVAAGDVTAAIEAAGKKLLESVEIFDLYEGDDLPPGTRSITYGLRFRADDRTLTDKEVDKAVLRILGSVKKRTEVVPRG